MARRKKSRRTGKSGNTCCPVIRLSCPRTRARAAYERSEKKAFASLGGFADNWTSIFGKKTASPTAAVQPTKNRVMNKLHFCTVTVGGQVHKRLTPQQAGRLVNALKKKQMARRCVPLVKLR